MDRTMLVSAGLATALSLAPGCNQGASQTDDNVEQRTPQTGWMSGPAVRDPRAPDPADTEEPRWLDVAAALDAWTPMLEDAPGDSIDGDSTHDLRRVMLVVTQRDVLVRFEIEGAPRDDDLADMRFWLEQDGRFLTVGTKRAPTREECTLSEVGKDVRYRVDSCYHISANRVDIAIPRSELPAIIEDDDDFWISGPQVCCSDEARTVPFDNLNASQVAWRVPAQT